MMKKTMIAALATLMLAGALSAVSGIASVNSAGPALFIGEGAAPIPLALGPAQVNSDPASLTGNF